MQAGISHEELARKFLYERSQQLQKLQKLNQNSTQFYKNYLPERTPLPSITIKSPTKRKLNIILQPPQTDSSKSTNHTFFPPSKISSTYIETQPRISPFNKPNFSFQRKKKKTTPKLNPYILATKPFYNFSQLSISGRQTYLYRMFQRPAAQIKQTLDLSMLKFLSKVQKRYTSLYNSLDMTKNGIVTRGQIEVYITKQLYGQNTKVPRVLNSNQHETILSHTRRVFNLFNLNNHKLEIPKQEIISVCAVFQFNSPHLVLDLMDLRQLDKLQSQVNQLRKVFQCYASSNRIESGLVQGLLLLFGLEGKVWKVFEIVSSRKIGFVWFLRCLPFFVWFHLELYKQKLIINL